MTPPGPGRNSNFDWNEFNPESYLEHNYAEARKDDIRFVSTIGDFFLGRLGGSDALRGVDVGTGTNLYPALAMLPFCRDITLIERSEANLKWLEREVLDYSRVWDPFWRELAAKERYPEVADPAGALRTKAVVESGSIFTLPRNKWEIGTMFFVAESISADVEEFREGLRCFIGSLVPGAPFAAGFMEQSQGYKVDGRLFPAVSITDEDIRKCLKGLVEDDLQFTFESVGDHPLRHGYTGMILACGRKRRAETGTGV
ncbi:SCO2525 family SAM-dependent methyltransferase [Actinocorallia aurantiaca]|uniref:SCO2525 family SAM-dependent methyltransferase n=1 Tax=Actinocorallia aurantiaca TaxID=46204 RepID=A0ABP6GQU1_9ACTN